MSTEIRTPDGRLFTLIRQEPYQRKDGTWTTLNVWESLCGRCAGPFEIKLTLGASQWEHGSQFSLVHCPDHRLTREEATKRWQAGIQRAREAKKAAK